MRLRGTALVMAGVLLMAAGGCMDDDGGRATTLGAGKESMPTPPPPLRSRPVYKEGEIPPPPVGPGVEVGIAYPFELYTHCGIEWARIDGVWWKTTPKLSDGSGNPPRNQGWGNPFEGGTLTVLDQNTAEFVSANGNRVRFARTADDGPPPCV